MWKHLVWSLFILIFFLYNVEDYFVLAQVTSQLNGWQCRSVGVSYRTLSFCNLRLNVMHSILYVLFTKSIHCVSVGGSLRSQCLLACQHENFEYIFVSLCFCTDNIERLKVSVQMCRCSLFATSFTLQGKDKKNAVSCLFAKTIDSCKMERRICCQCANI